MCVHVGGVCVSVCVCGKAVAWQAEREEVPGDRQEPPNSLTSILDGEDDVLLLPEVLQVVLHLQALQVTR